MFSGQVKAQAREQKRKEKEERKRLKKEKTSTVLTGGGGRRGSVFVWDEAEGGMLCGCTARVAIADPLLPQEIMRIPL